MKFVKPLPESTELPALLQLKQDECLPLLPYDVATIGFMRSKKKKKKNAETVHAKYTDVLEKFRNGFFIAEAVKSTGGGNKVN